MGTCHFAGVIPTVFGTVVLPENPDGRICVRKWIGQVFPESRRRFRLELRYGLEIQSSRHVTRYYRAGGVQVETFEQGKIAIRA